MEEYSPGVCTVCREEGKDVPSVAVCSACPAYFCETCLNLHNKMPISRNHKTELTDIGQEEPSICQLHENQKTTLYCRSCKEALCCVCHQESHSSCTDVVGIHEFLPEVKATLQKLKESLEKELELKRNRLEKHKCQRRALMEITSKAENSIKERSDMAVNMIRAKECDLLGKLTSINVNRPSGSQTTTDWYEEMTGSVDTHKKNHVPPIPPLPVSVTNPASTQSTATTDAYVQPDSMLQTRGEESALKEDVQYLNSSINETAKEENKTRLRVVTPKPSPTGSTPPIPSDIGSTGPLRHGESYEDISSGDYSLAKATGYDQLNTEIKICNPILSCNIEEMKTAVENFNLGTLDNIPLGLADLSSTPCLIKTIDTKPQNAKDAFELKDVLVTRIDGIQTVVVTFEDNHCIKSFWTRHGREEFSSIEIKKDRPWAITAVKGNTILATLPSECEIVEVVAYPQLRLRNTISTMKSYYGICYLGDSRIAVCVRNDISKKDGYSCVDILDLQGNFLKSIKVDNINSPDYACVTNEGNILMSDFHHVNCVVCVSPDGPQLFSSPLVWPTGISATYAGYVLAADRGSNSVVQLSEIGEHVRTLLTSDDGVDGVNGIWYHDETASLYVTCGHFVKVFSFV